MKGKEMNDPREELSPYWLQTISSFGTPPQPPGSPPKPGSEFVPLDHPVLSMWDWSRIPAPPALLSWFPPAPMTSRLPPRTVDHVDSADYWGASAEPSYAENRGILYSLSAPYRSPVSGPWSGETDATGSTGILGSLSAPHNPSLGQPHEHDSDETPVLSTR